MSGKTEDLGYARLDLDREARCGRPEVVFAAGKTPEEVAGIAVKLVEKTGRLLATRCDESHFHSVSAVLPQAVFHRRARCVTAGEAEPDPSGRKVGVVCAGTSDLPVAEECLVTLQMFGRRTERFTDVGVAGIHRLFDVLDAIRACDVLVVIAGMEGALPSVIGGLTRCPVIAVPTSVGYGASFGGLAALLGMLNSCASGLVVTNIDNGFGAAAAVDRILGVAAGSVATP